MLMAFATRGPMDHPHWPLIPFGILTDPCRRQGGCCVLLQVFLSTHQSPPHSLITP